MTDGWLEEAIKECRLRPPSRYPRDLEGELALALPITLERRHRLTTGHVRDWLAALPLRRSHQELLGESRRLHGCMVAHAGKGVIFVDSSDDEDEQRFTLAHEVAHFVLDSLLPRARAKQAFGKDILPVLDGLREPTTQQKLFSVLERVPFGVQVNLMDRNDSGELSTGAAIEAEQRADRLAFELLAPEKEVLPLLSRASSREVETALVSRFGLSAKEAPAYVRLLRAREPASRPFFLDGPRGRFK